MYKILLNKGFKPVYYTNDDWFEEGRNCKSRLFYRYRLESKELLHSVFNTLDIFDEYFFVLENDDVVVEIESDEDLNGFWLYFYNMDIDDYDVPKDKLNDLFNVIPNQFTFEYQN